MDPLVTVVVTHHLDENRPYLNLALEGLSYQNVPTEIIVLADSETKPAVRDGVKLVYDKGLHNVTQKIHYGFEMAHPASKYFMHHSDDVVLSNDCLEAMVSIGPESLCIQSPISNSDMGSRYWTAWPFKPDMRLEDVSKREIFQFDTGYANLFIKQDWVCFFAPLIPRKVWETVGKLDEQMDLRHNDQDYCIRAARLGIPSVINAGAFAFHFGSRTLAKESDQAKNECTDHFRRKYGGN